jgi:hypothetical protein
MMSSNPCSATRRQLSNVANLATESLGVVQIALGCQRSPRYARGYCEFFCECFLQTIPNGIFVLILCFVAVNLRWGVTFLKRATAHHRFHHGVGASKCLRGGADKGLDSCYAACGCCTEYQCGALPGGVMWRHA